jgi:ATP-binding cassette subfamily B protein
MRRRYPGRPPLLVEVWAGGPGLGVLLAGLVVIGAAAPLVAAWAVAGVVRALPAAVTRGEWGAVPASLALLAVCFVLGQAAQTAAEAVSVVLSQRVECDLESRLLAAAVDPDHRAEPGRLRAAVAAVTGAGPDRTRPSRGVIELAPVATAKLTGVGALVALGRWHVWVPVLLGATWAITVLWQQREGTTARSLTGRRTEGLRRAAYLRDLALEPATAKEIRLFGLSRWLADRYREISEGALAAVRAERRGQRGQLAAALGVVTVVPGLCFVRLALDGATGNLPTADVALYAQLIVASMAAGWGGDGEWVLRAGGRAAATARRVASPDRAARPSTAPTTVGAGPPSVDFEAVSFTYAGQESPALDGFSFHLAAGASLALVGENGAGKSTVVKVLAGLLRPAAGAVTVSGSDTTVDVRARLACLLQDPNRYDATLRLNVALGVADPESVTDADCLAALHLAGAGPLLDQLPHGLDTELGLGYAGSVGLSGGQWQRVALARALLRVGRGADLVMLDEPTSALDITAETVFFDRFFAATAGLTRVVVSHRLASVRRADVIVVVHDGRAAEIGTHDDLLARRGRYHAMFELQASAFAAAGAPRPGTG